jgi:hypothetical protein
MDKTKVCIQSYCTIRDNKIMVDGKTIFESAPSLFSVFAKQSYQHLGINYPKFFKMDQLSKLAFLAAEVLLRNEAPDTDIALVFANRSSSLDTDMKHQKSISDKENYFPSPSVFVYTLPNICIGEISIRHQLKSENSFFIFDAFNPAFTVAFANSLLGAKKAEKVLCGWVEYYDENYEVFLYLTANEGEMEHNEATVKLVYNK